MRLAGKMLLTLVLALGIFVSPLSGVGIQSADAKDRFLNIAHRGASGYAPENTLAAFDKAVEMKADYFELDVQMSKDGHLVLMHDTTVDRTTNGTGYVKDLTLEELKQLDAGSWFSPEFAGEKIPTLEEVLDRYRGKIGILIEIKSPSLYPGIEEKVAQALRERNMHLGNQKIIVQSFDHDSMKKYHAIQPRVPVGVLVSYSAYPNGVSDAELATFATYAQYVNPNQVLVDEDLVQRVHRFGMKITPYTVRDQASADRLIAAGVDGIITDFPELGYVK